MERKIDSLRKLKILVVGVKLIKCTKFCNNLYDSTQTTPVFSSVEDGKLKTLVSSSLGAPLGPCLVCMEVSALAEGPGFCSLAPLCDDGHSVFKEIHW